MSLQVMGEQDVGPVQFLGDYLMELARVLLLFEFCCCRCRLVY